VGSEHRNRSQYLQLSIFHTLHSIKYNIFLTMKLSLIVSFFFAFCYDTVLVTADRMITFTFNNGTAPTESVNCTEADNLLIAPIFNVSTYVRRNLRTADITPANHNDALGHGRDLATTKKCADDCKGQVPTLCRTITGCHGNGRMLQQGLNLTLSACSDHIATMHSMLDNLITTNAISSGCQLVLDKSKRNATCFDGIVSGEIESFAFTIFGTDPKFAGIGWAQGYYRGIPARTDVRNVQNGFSFCASNKINIEAVIIPCLKNVAFTLTGPNGYSSSRVDTVLPMKLSDNNFFGKLTAGSYTVTAVPDNNEDKKKTLTFTVKGGC
jgi:hypothetical protein